MSCTQRSFRAYLPSTLKANGVGEADIKWLSAWNAKGGDSYVRSARAITRRLQNNLTTAIREGKGEEADEREIIDRVSADFQRRGLSPGSANDAATKLGKSQGEQETAKTVEENGEELGRQMPQRGYVLSFSQKRKLRRLHWICTCHPLPGLGYQH